MYSVMYVYSEPNDRNMITEEISSRCKYICHDQKNLLILF